MRRLLIVAASSTVTVCGATASPAAGAATLPIVCVAGSCGASGPTTWLGSGQATATSVGNTLTISQTSEQAVLNWSSFNVSADGRVIFKQPDSSSIALNQIFQASPSQIFGLVQANGQIYLVNQNGIIFGSTAQVNVGGLLASTLSLTAPLGSGLLSAVGNAQPALASDGRTNVLDGSGNPVLDANGEPIPVQIVVQPGAAISANGQGERIMLAGQSVVNGGSISAPGGQIVLAAGQSVYLQASTEPSLRGLVVEVDGQGTVSNQLPGNLSVAEGNVTLVGLAVNQQGRISATTSVSENGSIYLLAQNSVNIQNESGAFVPLATQGGTLTLGPESVTQVLPDTISTATAIPAQAQPQSEISLVGRQVELQGGSNVTAPGGAVTITASSDPSVPNLGSSPDPQAQLRIDPGATIDVAGSVTSVPVTDNLISVTLRGSELADDPLQRNGPLRGETVIIDATVGTPLANVSGDIALIQSNVLQRTATGGSITLDSGGDVVVGSGATLNVSGGQVDYTPGLMQTSLLVKPDGTTVNIANASPNQTYVGVINPTYESLSNQWGVISFTPTPGIAYYDPGYVQGASAGSIQVLGSSLVLNGTFLGQAVNGINQRSGSAIAQGGTFSIGLLTPIDSNGFADYRAPAVTLVSEVAPTVVARGTPLPSDLPVDLSTSVLSEGGFTHLNISSNDQITIPAGVNLEFAPGGSLTLQAPQIDLYASISIPGGTLAVTSTPSFSTVFGTPGLGITVGSGISFDVSGLWTNDTLVPLSQTPTGLTAVNAGSIALDQEVYQGTLSLGSDVQLVANGGAQLARGGTLTAGTGGAIALVGSPGGTVQVGNGDVVQGFGVDGALGGSFTLEVPRLLISSGTSSWLSAQSVGSDSTSNAVFGVDASLFSNYGFSSFTLTADGPRDTAGATGTSTDTLTVTANTAIDLRTRTLELAANDGAQPTGASLTDFSTVTLLPAFQRTGATLTLQAIPGEITASEIGDVTVGAGATITADPGSTITLASVGNLTVNGSIVAPASTVNLDIKAPAASEDPGYQPSLAVTLGPSASIDVAGTAVFQPSDIGVLNGQVLAGGTVSLNAARGSIVTDVGSTINFSGTQATVDLGSSTGSSTALDPQIVASAAGTLSVSAPTSISLLGSFVGEPGVGTTGAAAGGTLDVTVSRLSVGIGNAPGAPAVIVVQPGALTAPLAPANVGAVISTGQLASSGVDALNITADAGVVFANATELSLARSLTLTAPVVGLEPGASAALSAPYVALGSASSGEAAGQALPGTGALTVNGSEIDLIGSLAFQGVNNATLTSLGSILLRGELLDTSNLGSVSIAGELTLAAARVVPTTAVDFTITASGGANNTVQFLQNGTLSGVPLSVGGTLSVDADNILQAGTVFAPFGQLNFVANQTLTFAPGSLTSVSGTAAVLPYGQVQNGTSWVYQVSSTELAPASVTALPNRQVTASGSKVTLESGATIDVSGGGDLSAYTYTSGTGGTNDVLSNTVTPGLYAVLPSLAGQTAPYDPEAWAGSNLTPNESVYLSGGSGLAAGVYPLLPARYGLLPGAYLVQVVSGYQDIAPGTAIQSANGYPIVSGYFTYGNTGIGDTRTNGFLVEPGSYATQLANYTTTLASNFFATSSATASTTSAGLPSSPLPADGGTLVVSAQSEFDALGKVNGTAATGGVGANVDIVGPQILVDPSISAPAASTPGQIVLSSAVLDSWNAGRLWLGASVAADGSVAVGSTSVEIASGSTLTADEVLLAATAAIQVEGGATLTTPSVANSSLVPAAATAGPTPLPLSGSSAGAAILAVSDLTAWVPDRTASMTGAASTLSIATGAEVASRGALTLDAPGGGTLADGTLLGPGASWSIGADALIFGTAGSAGNGYALDASLVTALSGGAGVRLASSNPILFDQPVNLTLTGASGSAPSSITLLAPGLVDDYGPGTSSFGARLITLGSSTTTSTPSSTGLGTLALTAGVIDVGPGSVALAGFTTTTLDAADAIVGEGTGSLATGGALSLLTPLITAASGSQTQVQSTGNLTLGGSSQTASGTAPVLQSGGTLVFTGSVVADSTTIAMPSGEVSMSAIGGLTIASGASIEVAGLQPANAPHGSDGGTIALSAGGNVSVASGSSMSVAAGPGANAGTISVTAAGAADFEATLDGSISAGEGAASFTLQAGSLTNFSSLNDSLERSGFNATRSIEVATGDLDLAAGSSITAQTVVLAADSGAVNIAGTINSSGAGGGGSIGLYAGGNLSLASTAVVTASGLGSGTTGGQIELASTGGVVQINPAAQVAALGSGKSGSLLVRAPLSAAGDDLNLASLPSNLANVGTVILEPEISATLSSAPDAAQFAAIESGLASTMSAADPVILTRLGLDADANVALRPYANLTTVGDLTLPSVNFETWRFNGQPVDLSIRATGTITVAGTLSDGFQTSAGFLDVGTGPSARLSLVAGANLDAAAPTAVTAGLAADLDLAAGSVVRTGTGALELSAARDVVFGTGASVYTGGIQGVPSTTGTDTGVPLSFPTDGGSIFVTAGRNVVGSPMSEAVDQWNPRFEPNVAAIWGIDFQEFQWNVGALGGGNVLIRAGGSATNVSAAVADSRTFAADGMTSIALGGGNLTVDTGGDVDSGLFYVGNGIGTIDAGGALGSARSTASGTALGTLLLAGDASFNLTAQGNVLLQGILSETALQPGYNSDSVFFLRYAPGSVLAVQSKGGSITYDSNPGLDTTLIGVLAASQTDPNTFQAAPPSVDLAAFGGNVILGSNLIAVPSTNGELTVYAAGNLTSSGGASLGMSDQALSTIASADLPSQYSQLFDFSGVYYTSASLHQNDPVPVLIAAGGDIENIQFDLPKQASLIAGGNITSMTLAGQNLNPTDITLVDAGGNIEYTDADSSRSITLTGPGQLEVAAGGNIDLGLSQGITTYGNILNANLASSTGASITVLAGLRAPIGVGGSSSSTDFLSTVIAPSSANQTLLVDYVQQITGGGNLSFATAEQDFRGFTLAQQLPLIENVLFSQLVLSGEQANEVPSLGFGLGYAAIDSLFPGSRGSTSAYSGNVTLGYSRIYTLDGGSISILVPGGSVDVGLANPPANFSVAGIDRTPSQLGIVAVGSGDVDIYSLGNVLVNQSRVFTLGGGDLTIWSTLGNIDAGNGAKTSISAPPPTVEVDSNGNVTLNFGAAIAGSGIQTIQSEPDVAAGNVNLIAPVGFVNAGDAGISSAGDINIAAQKVLGASNISFGGTATGVPPAVSGIGVSLSGASSVGSSATTAASTSVDNGSAQAAAAAPVAAEALSWLDVFVEGFGADVCKPNDTECLQKSHKAP